MKNKFLTTLACLISLTAYFLLISACQPEEKHGTDLDLVEVEGAGMTGAEKYAYIHHLLRTKEGMSHPEYQTGDQLREYKKALRALPLVSDRSILNWQERGPSNVGGRTRGLLVDPTDPDGHTWYAGSVGGGVWRTENAGQSWEWLTSDMLNLATSALGMSAANPDVIYAGTGEALNPPHAIAGTGIWKTTNRGETWEPLQSTINNSDFSSVWRIVVNPDDENELLVCTAGPPGPGSPESFILKSTDGGETWEEKYVSNGNPIQQIIAAPSDFSVQYAGINSTGIIKSVDAGETWEMVYTPIEEGEKRYEMAVSSSNPDVVYVSRELDFGIFTFNSPVVYTHDGFATVQPSIYPDLGVANQNWMGFFGWYNNTIAVHPYDDNIVWAASNFPMLELKPATGELNVIFDATGFFGGQPKGVHVDHHNIVFIPIDETTETFYVLNANDGGVAFSEDGGESFIQTGSSSDDGTGTISYGYNVGQFYGVDKMNGADRYVGGAQDNGSWLSPPDPDEATAWEYVAGSDGGQAAWHYTDPNLILVSASNNLVYKSTDGGTDWQPVNFNLPLSQNPFYTRIETSHDEPDLVFLISGSGIIKSTDFLNSAELITMPSGWAFDNIFGGHVKISLADPDIVWAGSGMGPGNQLTVSTNQGESFQTTNNYTQAALGIASGLATHPAEPNTAFAIFSQANGPKVLRTEDLGQTWTDITGFNGNVDESTNGFPDVAVFSFLVMPFDTDWYWAGTEIGVFESKDAGQTWTYTDNGLPAASIWQMKVVNDEIVLATHGRGIWTVDISELENPPSSVNDLSKGISSLQVYPNPVFTSATVSFHLEEKQNIRIDLVSMNGQTIETLFQGKKMAGEQQVEFSRNNNLPNGGYFVKITPEKGATKSNKVIFK